MVVQLSALKILKIASPFFLFALLMLKVVDIKMICYLMK